MQKQHHHLSKTKNLPSLFIQKLFSILQSPNFFNIISWSQCETFFVIKNIDRLEKQILPQFFRHKQLNSFIRQLNMYNFHKLRNCKKHQLAFKHEDFTRDNSQNFGNIARKGVKGKEQKQGEFQSNQHNCHNNKIFIENYSMKNQPNISEKHISLGLLPSFRFTCSKLSIGINQKFGEVEDVQEFQQLNCQSVQNQDNISIICEEQQKQMFWYDKSQKNVEDGQTTKLLQAIKLESFEFCFDL